MTTLNPDFRGVDEVHVPKNMADQLSGWAPDALNEREALAKEERMFGELQDDMPYAMRARYAAEVPPDRRALWDAFMVSKGRQAGDMDMTLLDEWVHGRPLVYLPQIIGSCVESNTFPGVVGRMMYETALLQQPQEYLGRDEFGPRSFAPYGPFNYGAARKRANMRGGDGLYMEPMAESMIKDGFLSCNTPALLRLVKQLGVDKDKDMPEPQSANVYRQFGAWRYIDDLAQYAAWPVTECPVVKDIDTLWRNLMAGMPSFVCSSEAIHKVGVHADGFAIHARNPRDSWAHNMLFFGAFTASNGDRFIRESNQSWGPQHVYNRRYEEVDASFKARRLSVASIGDILGPQSAAPLAA